MHTAATHFEVPPSPSLNRTLQRNKWLVAYTLIKNPSLRDLRANNLAKKKLATPHIMGEDAELDYV